MDGRIDDPSSGGRDEVLATVSTRAPFHMEGGKGTTSKVLHSSCGPSAGALTVPGRVGAVQFGTRRSQPGGAAGEPMGASKMTIADAENSCSVHS